MPYNKDKNVEIDLQSVTQAIANRDQADSSRSEAPLRKAEDAILVDTANLDIEDVSQLIIDLYKARFNG